MSARTHDFEPGDRVEWLHDEPAKHVTPESYFGVVTHVYDTSDTIVVRFDDGDEDQVSAGNFRTAA